MDFSEKEKTLINFLLIFYKNKLKFFQDILNQKTPLSLRLIDWLVTNYSKKYNIIYNLHKDNDIKYFNIYLDYKNQLKAYSKKFFDPFCRQKRLMINVNNISWKVYEENSISSNYIVTTVGQLNFFKWFIENRIYEYTLNNIKLIDLDMTNTMNSKNKDHRTVLSPSALKGIYTTSRNITIKFRI
jgi:hypothetical protein